MNNISDTYYFHVINRFENGDKCGIDVSERVNENALKYKQF